MEERDNQRQKLYNAERFALEAFAEPLETVKDIERYLLRQSKRATLIKRYGRAVDLAEWKLTVSDGRGCVRALAYGTYKISIPLWARKNWVVLHEWAHVIHDRLSSNRCAGLSKGSRRDELKGGAAHGWQFAAIYLDLVHFCMGKEAAAALKASFRKHRVRIKPKTTREVTPAMLANLQAAREARNAA